MSRAFFQLGLLLWFSLSFTVNSRPDLPYVIPVDDGLYHATIQAYGPEWNATFPNDEIPSSPVYFWFRCLNQEVRVFFTISSMRKKPVYNQPEGGELKFGGEKTMRHLKLLVDEKPQAYRAWFGGADFTVDVSKKPLNSFMTVSVEGWSQITAFPISQCRPNVVEVRDTNLVMHVHTFDQYNKPQNSRLLRGLAKHLVYHRCALNLTKYEVVIQDDHLKQYLKNDDLRRFAEQGTLIFLLKGYNPPRLGYGNCNWQSVYENMAILRYWKQDTRLAIWNSDEYISYNPSISAVQLRQQLMSYSSVGIRRYMTFCREGCVKDKAELRYLSFSKSKYGMHPDKLSDPKLIINPDKVGCFIMHWAGCGDATEFLSNDTALILHFENLYDARWKSDAYVMKNMTDLDLNRLPLMTCDPDRIHTFSYGAGTPVVKAMR